MDIDSQIVTYFAEHRTWILDRAALLTMVVVTSWVAVAIVGLAGSAIVIWLRIWRVALAGGLALVSSIVVVEALKGLIDRGRPTPTFAMVHAVGASMPSAAAAITAAAAVATYLAVDWPTPMVRRTAAAALTASVLWVGFCVVYMGVHWPTDVVAGWLVGGGIGLTATTLLGRLRPRPIPP